MADGNVVTICGVALPPPNEPNQNALKAAEDLLEMVRSGEVVGLGIVTGYRDHSAGSNIAGLTGTNAMVGAAYGLTTALQKATE